METSIMGNILGLYWGNDKKMETAIIGNILGMYRGNG